MNKQQQPTIVQAIPIQPQIQVIQPQVIQPSHKIKETYRYAKSVKLFATIEAILCILYGFYQPWFFLQAIGPIAGYYGAKKFNKFLSYFYFTYLILALLTKLIVLSLTKPTSNFDIKYV